MTLRRSPNPEFSLFLSLPPLYFSFTRLHFGAPVIRSTLLSLLNLPKRRYTNRGEQSSANELDVVVRILRPSTLNATYIRVSRTHPTNARCLQVRVQCLGSCVALYGRRLWLFAKRTTAEQRCTQRTFSTDFDTLRKPRDATVDSSSCLPEAKSPIGLDRILRGLLCKPRLAKFNVLFPYARCAIW